MFYDFTLNETQTNNNINTLAYKLTVLMQKKLKFFRVFCTPLCFFCSLNVQCSKYINCIFIRVLLFLILKKSNDRKIKKNGDLMIFKKKFGENNSDFLKRLSNLRSYLLP